MVSLVFPGPSEFQIIHVSESEPLAVGTDYGKFIQVSQHWEFSLIALALAIQSVLCLLAATNHSGVYWEGNILGLALKNNKIGICIYTRFSGICLHIKNWEAFHGQYYRNSPSPAETTMALLLFLCSVSETCHIAGCSINIYWPN